MHAAQALHGIVYDAKQLLTDVAAMVEQQKRERASTPPGR